ncbi:DNA cytosine methyltransferase [Deinococcus petrolearius]|uniref:DNA (cytosine-5-)-methyltransferase n=1 Tax=Deinococcus petrolearius TaxID=1751295 RepID=A0ABW1DEI0_9DEIO
MSRAAGAEAGGVEAVSVFAGAGGLDLGARMAGVNVVASIERDPLACEALALNGFHPVQADVTGVDFRQWRGVDVLFGGPPCQGHSRANHAGVGLERNALVREMLRAARETRAREVLIENVATFGRALLGEVMDELTRMGYWVGTEVLNAAHYGVPQTRERRFIRAVRGDLARPWPQPTHLRRPVTIDATLSDLYPQMERAELPRWSAGLNYKPDVRLMDNQTSFPGAVLGRTGDEPAQTITNTCHYWRVSQGGEVMKLGIRAAARLQSFPDEYRFVGGVGAQSLQIANAVPPLLAAALFA